MNIDIYTKTKILPCGYQLVSVHQYATRCCHLRAWPKKSELGRGPGSYAVILLVSPLGSVTIAYFNRVSVHCFVVALFSALYVYSFQISCSYIIACGQPTSILRKYSGNGRCQAIFLLPCSLDMRLPGRETLGLWSITVRYYMSGIHI